MGSPKATTSPVRKSRARLTSHSTGSPLAKTLFPSAELSTTSKLDSGDIDYDLTGKPNYSLKERLRARRLADQRSAQYPVLNDGDVNSYTLERKAAAKESFRKVFNFPETDFNV